MGNKWEIVWSLNGAVTKWKVESEKVACVVASNLIDEVGEKLEFVKITDWGHDVATATNELIRNHIRWFNYAVPYWTT